MFLHMKSPLFRDEITDILLSVHAIECIDIISKIRNDQKVYLFIACTSDAKATEAHPTLESAQNRMKEILIMMGHTEEDAKKISSEFIPEDRTKDCDKHEKIKEALVQLKKIADKL